MAAGRGLRVADRRTVTGGASPDEQRRVARGQILAIVDELPGADISMEQVRPRLRHVDAEHAAP